MTTENIKTVMDMISQLGVNGKEAFVWYLMCAEVLPTMIGATVGLIVLYVAYRLCCGLFTLNYCYAFFKRVRDENGIGSDGLLSEREATEVVRLLCLKLRNIDTKGENK